MKKRWSGWFVFICFGFYGMSHLFFLPPLWADEDGAEVQKALVMDEIVVTATKTEEKRKEVPNAVIVKDVVHIQESPARGVGELLANEPGVDWRTYGDFGGAGQEIHISWKAAREFEIDCNYAYIFECIYNGNQVLNSWVAFQSCRF